MKSIWKKETDLPSFEPLSEDIKTDVLVIGGGMAGLLTAYMLKNQGVRCVVAEAGRIYSVTSGNTTAKITLQHGLIYDSLIRRFGMERARLYLDANLEALKKYEMLSSKIACEYEKRDAYVYSLSSKRKIERELEAYERLSFDASFSSAKSLPFKTEGAVRVKNQAQFNPLMFVRGIINDITVYEDTRVLSLEDGVAITSRGKIHYKNAIVATHFPFLNRHGWYFLKMYQHRSYVLALKNAADVGGMYVDENSYGLSFRNYKDKLILGGGAHRTGKRGGGFDELRACAKEYYPDSEITCEWAAQDCMTLDSVPYIGKYSMFLDNVLVATGFNKWGMSGSMVAAMLLSDMILEKENDYQAVFSPSRSILRPQLAVNLIESIGGLLRPTAPRCTHLGCALRYNKAEHSWDCACHGSRFSDDGEILNNPATGIRKKCRKMHLPQKSVYQKKYGNFDEFCPFERCLYRGLEDFFEV